MRMLKKLSLILALILLLHSTVALASDSDAAVLSLTLTNVFHENGLEARDIMLSGPIRALLTVVLAADFYAETHLTINLADATFVGREGNNLIIYAHMDTQDVMMLYDPSDDFAVYVLSGPASDSVVERALATICVDGYYQNTQEDVYDAIMGLLPDD